MGGLDSGQTELAFLVCSFRCWWKRDLKLPFLPIPSNKPAQKRHLFLQPSPAKAWLFDRAWNSCWFWFSRSPSQGWYTSQDGQHYMNASTYPSCSPGPWVLWQGISTFTCLSNSVDPAPCAQLGAHTAAALTSPKVWYSKNYSRGKLASHTWVKTHGIPSLQSTKLRHSRATKRADITDPYSAKPWAINFNTLSLCLSNIFKYFC